MGLFFRFFLISSLVFSLPTLADTFRSQLGGFAKSAFTRFRPAAAASSSVFCNTWGAAPSQFPWEVASSDVDGDYVVLKYSIPDGVAVPSGLPRHIIFSWQRNGQYAPWIVYYGSEAISAVKINSVGDVAFHRFVPATTSTGVSSTDLVSCVLDQSQKNLQFGAYPCANSPTSAVLVSSIPNNFTATSPLGAQPNQPDGKFFEFDWSYDRLFWSRTQPSTLTLSVEAWDRFTLQTQNVESTFAPASAPILGWFRQVDSQGVLGFGYANLSGLFSGGLTFVAKGTSQIGLGSSAYFAPSFTIVNQTHLNSILSFGYSKFGNEFFGFSTDVSMMPASSIGRLGLVSSEDNFFGYFSDRIVSPNPNNRLRKPTKLVSGALGEILALEAQDALTQQVSIEIYQYQSSGVAGIPGSFLYMETVDADPGFFSISLRSGTDVLGSAGMMTVQYQTPTSTSGLHTLVRCF